MTLSYLVKENDPRYCMGSCRSSLLCPVSVILEVAFYGAVTAYKNSVPQKSDSCEVGEVAFKQVLIDLHAFISKFIIPIYIY